MADMNRSLFLDPAVTGLNEPQAPTPEQAPPPVEQPSFAEVSPTLDLPAPALDGGGELPTNKPQDQLWTNDYAPRIEDIILNYRDMEARGEQLKTPEEMFAITEQEAGQKALSIEDQMAGELLKQQTLQRAYANLLTNHGISQDEVQRSRLIGARLGIPANLVRGDLPRYERELTLKEGIEDIRDDPSMLAFYSKSENQLRANEDRKQYGAISRLAGGFSQGYSASGLTRQQAEQNALEIMSGRPPTLFPQGSEAEDWSGWIGEQAGALVGGFQDSAVYGGGIGAVTGGLTGAGTGFLVGGPVGAVAGAGAGAVTGFKVGTATDQTLQTYGMQAVGIYKKAIEQGATPEQALYEAQKLAGVSLPVQFGLNLVSVAGPVNRLGSAILGKSGGTVAGDLSKSVTAGALEGGVTNAISEGISASSEYQGLTNLGIAIPEGADAEVRNRVLKAMGIGAVGGGVLSGGASALGHTINRLRKEAPVALQTEQTLTQVIDALSETKTAKEDPEILSSFLQVRLAGEKGENAFMPLEKVQEMALKHPEAFAKIAESVPDLEQQMRLAGETGADVSLPTHALLAYLQQDMKAFVPDTKVTPDGMTPNEARGVAGELDTATRQAVDTAVQEVNQSFTSGEFVRRESLRRTLEDDIRTAYGKTFTKQQRKDLSEYYTSYFEATAKSNANVYGDALDEYNRRPILFQKSAEAEAVDKARTKIMSDIGRKKSRKEAEKILSEQVQVPSVVVGEGGDTTFRGTKLTDSTVYVGDESVPTEVMVVEADTLRPTFETGENQPRNREGKASEGQIAEIKGRFKPAYLRADFPDMTHGAPTLTRDGRIVGGNGRVEAIKRRYQEGGAEEYRAMVQEEATKAGVSIGGMRNPVLIRVFKGEVDVERASVISNKKAGLGYSPTEQARVDNMDLPDVSRFVFNENGSLSPTGNGSAMREFLSKLSASEQADFVDADGDLTTAGQRRVQNAILYRAYGDTPLLGRMIEDISPEGVNINTAMTRIAPEMIRIEGMIEEGRLHNLSLKEDLLKAIDAFLYMKRKGGDVESYLSQGDMFGGGATPEVSAFLRLLEDYSRSPRGLATAILDAYRQIESLGDPQIGSLLGDVVIPTKEELLAGVQKPTDTQTMYQGNRGSLTFGDGDIPKVMSLFKDGDISTMVHELGHGALQDLRSDALDPALADAPIRRADWRATKDWFSETTPYLLDLHQKKNVFGSGRAERKAELQTLKEIEELGGADYVRQFIEGDLTPEASPHGEYLYRMFHELFARGAERYVMEGKAPNSALAGVFQRFAKALVRLYKMVEALDAPINDNMRQVFGRLIAADQETAKARTEQGLNPLFPTLESSGMSEAEYDRYVEGTKQQQARLLEKAINRNMKALIKEKTEEGKGKIEANQKRIEKAIRAEKPYQTFEAMQGIVLDEAEIKALKLKGMIPSELVGKDGLSLNTVAEMTGYLKPEDLADDLARLEKMRRSASSKKVSIEEAVALTAEKQAKQEFKDSIDREALLQTAVDMAHEAGFEENLTAELNALSRSFNSEDINPLPTVPLDEFVKALPEAVTAKDLKHWTRVEQKSGDKGREKFSANFIRSFVERRTQNIARLMQKQGIKAFEKAEKDLKAERKKQEILDQTRIQVSEINFDAMREYVKDIFDNATTPNLSNPKRFLDQERRSGERAQKYLFEGKPQKAYIEKVDQILARFMYDEAVQRSMDAVRNIDAGAIEARVAETMAGMDMRAVVARKRSYLNSERRAGNSAINHFNAGRKQEAFDAKMKQLTSFMMYKKALEFEQFKKTADRLYDRISKNKTLKNISPDAMAIMHLILQDQGYNTSRSQSVARAERFSPELQAYFGKGKNGQPLSLPEAISAFLTKEGDVSSREGVYIPEMFKSENAPERKAITVGQHQELYRMMISIYTHGRDEQTLYMNGKREDVETAVVTAVDVAMAGRGEYLEDNRATKKAITRTQAIKEWVIGIGDNVAASVTRAQVMFNRLDRNKAGGLFNRLLSNTHRGLGRFNKWTEGFDNGVADLRKAWGPEKWRKYIHGLNNVFIEGHNLGDHESTKGGMLKMTRGQALAIFINAGTHDNYQKLINGRAERADKTPTGWTEEAVDAFIMEHITKEDIEFAQIIWREVGKTWADLEAVEKRLRGIAPDKVLPRKIMTKFGEVQGDYFPLKYEDSGKSTKEMTRMEDMQSFGEAMNGMIASSSKNRLNNVKKPVSLDLWRGLEEARRSAYAVYVVEPYNDMAKVLKDRRVMKMISHVFSEEHYKALLDLMEDLKAPTRKNVGFRDHVQRWGAHLTAGTTITYFVHALKPIVDGIADSVATPLKKGVPTDEFKSAVQRFMKDPKREYEWALQFDSVKDIQGNESARWGNWKSDVEARYGIAQEGLKGFTKFGYEAMEATTRLNATLVARAVYEDFVKKNPLASMDEIHDAVNKVVLEAGVGNNVLDTTAFQRNKYGAFMKRYVRYPLQASNAMLDAFYTLIDGIKAREGSPQDATTLKDAGRMVSVTVGASIPALWYFFLSGLLPRDEEGNIDWSKLPFMLAMNLMTQGVPIVRDFGDIITQPDNPFTGGNLSPEYRDFARAVKDAIAISEKGEISERQFFNFMKAAGTITHVPTAGVRFGNFSYEKLTGQEENQETFPELLKGASRGYEK